MFPIQSFAQDLSFVFQSVMRIVIGVGLCLLNADGLQKALSQTQVTPYDVMQLCNEIRDIKKESLHDRSKGTVNKLKMLSRHLNSTPDLDRDIHARGGHNDVVTEYSTLCPFPPTNSQDIQTRHAPAPDPSLPGPSQTPPAPTPDHVPPASSTRTSSPPCEASGRDSEELPSAESMASGSPDSPDKIKASSLARK